MIKPENIKFACFMEDDKDSFTSNTAKHFTLEDVNLNPSAIPPFDIALPYMRFTDIKNNEVYAGDILCLEITKELLDSTFSGSNLGRLCLKEPDITEVYCVIDTSTDNLFEYDVYIAHDHKIESEDNEPESAVFGNDTGFPEYLAIKGAAIIGNIYAQPDFLTKFI